MNDRPALVARRSPQGSEFRDLVAPQAKRGGAVVRSRAASSANARFASDARMTLLLAPTSRHNLNLSGCLEPQPCPLKDQVLVAAYLLRGSALGANQSSPTVSRVVVPQHAAEVLRFDGGADDERSSDRFVAGLTWTADQSEPPGCSFHSRS